MQQPQEREYGMAESNREWMALGQAELRLRVRLTPKSSRDAVEGVEQTAEGSALKARVRAVPVDGKANAALVALIADWLEVPRSHVTLVAWHKSRIKSVAVAGDVAALAHSVQDRIDGLGKS